MLKAGFKMKRHFWSVLTRLILILSLGFISLLHAAPDKYTSHDGGTGPKRYTDETIWKKPYDDYEAFLKTVSEKGFEAITEYAVPAVEGAEPTELKGHKVSKEGVETLKKGLEVISKYRAGVVECAKKGDEASVGLKKFVDSLVTDINNIFVKNAEGDGAKTRDFMKREGLQVSVRNETILSYVAAIHAFQKKKALAKNVSGKLAEVSSGDKKLMEQLLSTASVLLGNTVSIDENTETVGGVKIAVLRESGDHSKGIFEAIDKIMGGLAHDKDACLVKWDAPVTTTDKPPAKPSETATTVAKPPGAPLPGTPGTPGTVNPTTLGAAVPPGTPGTAFTPPQQPNADAVAQRVAAEQDAIRAAEEARRRLLDELDRDDRDQDDLDKLKQLARLVQPQGNRSSDNDRSSQGPTFSPSVSPSSPGGGQQPQFQPPQYQGPVPQDSGIAQLLPMLLNQNRGSTDLSPELLRAVVKANTNEVPYTPPVVPQVNTSQTALLETLRMMQMQNMMNQQQVAARPNVYGGAPGGGGFASIRRGRSGGFTSSTGRAGQLSVAGSRARRPSPLAIAGR